MFDSLTAALGKALDLFRGQKTLTEENMTEGLKAVRQALLEADVHFKVAKDFVGRVKEKAVGVELIKSVDPGHQFIKIFHDELTALMGPEGAMLPHADRGPTVVMMAGLQGSGKTTTCAKLAQFQRKLAKPLRAVSPEGMARLERYAWPGNIRELQNVLERACVLSAGPVVEIVDELRPSTAAGSAAAAPVDAPSRTPAGSRAAPGQPVAARGSPSRETAPST